MPRPTPLMIRIFSGAVILLGFLGLALLGAPGIYFRREIRCQPAALAKNRGHIRRRPRIHPVHRSTRLIGRSHVKNSSAAVAARYIVPL